MKYKISVPAPCEERWEKMTPTSTGAFCSSCNNNVIDFSTMTDAQVVDHLQNNKGMFCGRFDLRQLDRLIEVRQKTSTNTKLYRLITSAILLLGNGEAKAINLIDPRPSIENIQMADNKPIKPLDLPKERKKVRGKIVDAETKAPLVGALIRIPELSIHAIADINGHFVMEIPDAAIQFALTMDVLYTGYENWVMEITEEAFVSIQECHLIPQPELITGIVALGRGKKKWWRRLFGTVLK